MSAHLISEDIRADGAPPVEILTEESKGGRKTFITGIFAQSEVVNGNRRMYPQSVLGEATLEYVKRAVSKRNAMALGELNHPKYPKPNAKEACHLVTELTVEGNDIIGKAQVLEDLPNGKIVKSLIDNGVVIGVSTRGLGAISEGSDGIGTVDRYRMYAVDVVTDPSAPDAYVKGLMEATEWLAADGVIDPKVLDEMNETTKREDASFNAMKTLLERLAEGRR